MPNEALQATARRGPRLSALEPQCDERCRQLRLLGKPLVTLPASTIPRCLPGVPGHRPRPPAGVLAEFQATPRPEGLTSAMVTARATVPQTGLGGRRMEP